MAYFFKFFFLFAYITIIVSADYLDDFIKRSSKDFYTLDNSIKSSKISKKCRKTFNDFADSSVGKITFRCIYEYVIGEIPEDEEELDEDEDIPEAIEELEEDEEVFDEEEEDLNEDEDVLDVNKEYKISQKLEECAYLNIDIYNYFYEQHNTCNKYGMDFELIKNLNNYCDDMFRNIILTYEDIYNKHENEINDNNLINYKHLLNMTINSKDVSQKCKKTFKNFVSTSNGQEIMNCIDAASATNNNICNTPKCGIISNVLITKAFEYNGDCRNNIKDIELVDNLRNVFSEMKINYNQKCGNTDIFAVEKHDPNIDLYDPILRNLIKRYRSSNYLTKECKASFDKIATTYEWQIVIICLEAGNSLEQNLCNIAECYNIRSLSMKFKNSLDCDETDYDNDFETEFISEIYEIYREIAHCRNYQERYVVKSFTEYGYIIRNYTEFNNDSNIINETETKSLNSSLSALNDNSPIEINNIIKKITNDDINSMKNLNNDISISIHSLPNRNSQINNQTESELNNVKTNSGERELKQNSLSCDSSSNNNNNDSNDIINTYLNRNSNHGNEDILPPYTNTDFINTIMYDTVIRERMNHQSDSIYNNNNNNNENNHELISPTEYNSILNTIIDDSVARKKFLK
ncbi:hypothetical protein BCR32DRAFT_266180 [Anaeromyces robustus]|uniref:Uncharacterized protein n=1 Tax=Anaeromyces robustus TaxID=1754192 RepID=A0A1Y1XFX0_9FUNG|nr:hypothetical protein BCR32DRAFT_266180 [Anaeromyces robustus]|eukprot:ORX84661.1 hypothetical protein BCR32DRAFT_266180 [Anaeromyces robustus]